ncbi:alanine racemase domain protein [Chloroherpeton thalassium ATCC 35110]|uniref:Pyridoxal phosphate homeostasis protein n=1 Tax=Chloroherpeton thalassium (strain ATCC 35110 / GB-78) TaxID=517418 RepID=B3QSR8_CHLT3|nr:YggS family pyridoxal phosphate-dependent enzyme [Chloroherpeton thalassium]ACF14115.1 alanine racemase domain protein [Chloroherpeton thalassium ATCC 35110]
MSAISENLARINDIILKVCENAGRKRDEVKLIAISKRKSAEAILEAYQAGQRYFGENYVQEFLDKVEHPLLANLEPEWHFTGHLQTNKIKYIADKVAMVQTIDKFATAEALSKRAEKEGLIVPILLEVNISNEDSKYGVMPEDLLFETEKIHELPNVAIHGLMTIGSPDLSDVGKEFQQMRHLLEQIAENSPNPEQVKELSMGMSQDFDIAIEEGATMVRIGTAIFGER